MRARFGPRASAFASVRPGDDASVVEQAYFGRGEAEHFRKHFVRVLPEARSHRWFKAAQPGEGRRASRCRVGIPGGVSLFSKDRSALDEAAGSPRMDSESL